MISSACKEHFLLRSLFILSLFMLVKEIVSPLYIHMINLTGKREHTHTHIRIHRPHRATLLCAASTKITIIFWIAKKFIITQLKCQTTATLR